MALRAELIDGGGTRRKKEGRKAQDMTRRQERGDDGDEGEGREAQEGDMEKANGRIGERHDRPWW